MSLRGSPVGTTCGEKVNMPKETPCRKCNRGIDRETKKECKCCGGLYTDCINCSLEKKITRWAIESYEKTRKDKTK